MRRSSARARSPPWPRTQTPPRAGGAPQGAMGKKGRMRPPLLHRLYRRLGVRYFWLFVAFEVVSAWLICIATVGLFALYTRLSPTEFWEVAVFAELCVVAALTYTIVKTRKMAAPLIAWMKGGRDPRGALDTWRAAVSFPRDFVA